MKIIDDSRKTSGWITAVVEGHWLQAKVYDLPSCYGVRQCRVSKLSISKTDNRNPNLPYFEQMAYNYDRGLDFHNKRSLKTAKLNKILDVLNALPVAG